ncbi:MAG: hypothetical protein HY254_03500 [Burkholderiales bacterium]|nr:hypothetical protein [Burkholderiales bacterium]
MSDISIGKLEVNASGITPVSASTTAMFGINMHEFQGRAFISWSENFAGKVRLSVAIYSGPQPANPRAYINATEVTGHSSGMWDSGQPWGTGYSASLLGVNEDENAWVYIGVNTPVTKK